MAQIYLKHLKDKKMFTQCYKQMVDMSPTPQSYVLLGDAYMSIQEPERALETYEQAVRRSPKDPQLAAKMGQVGQAVCYDPAKMSRDKFIKGIIPPQHVCTWSARRCRGPTSSARPSTTTRRP